MQQPPVRLGSRADFLFPMRHGVAQRSIQAPEPIRHGTTEQLPGMPIGKSVAHFVFSGTRIDANPQVCLPEASVESAVTVGRTYARLSAFERYLLPNDLTLSNSQIGENLQYFTVATPVRFQGRDVG